MANDDVDLFLLRVDERLDRMILASCARYDWPFCVRSSFPLSKHLLDRCTDGFFVDVAGNRHHRNLRRIVASIERFDVVASQSLQRFRITYGRSVLRRAFENDLVECVRSLSARDVKTRFYLSNPAIYVLMNLVVREGRVH